MLAPRGARARLTVLIFHRVLPSPDPLRPSEPDVQEFEAKMSCVSRWFNVLPLADAVRGLSTGDLPECPLSITFDDGYLDNYTLALPILTRLGLHATFFVASGFLDGGRMWNDTVIEAIRAHRAGILDLRKLGLQQYRTGTTAERREAIHQLVSELMYRPADERTNLATAIAALTGARLPEDLMMTSQHVAALHRHGMAVGAHTVTHPILLGLSAAKARDEIAASKAHLERITQAPVTLFAYPKGVPARDYGREHVAMVRDLGFKAAVSTAWGVSRVGSDVFQIPRFTPWDRLSWKYGARLMQNLFRSSYQTA
jgi:peptidoglycan/xylan/chitin deacetylase (PgdA/CDA1 family)